MEKREVVEVIRANWWQVGLIGFGMSFLIVGIVVAKRQTVGDSLVIISASPSPGTTQTQLLVVDVSGAVEKPGIYRLPAGSRIGEAIIAAGGLGSKADRSFVAQSINQAEVVRDGMKIFIPEIGNTQTSNPSASSGRVISVNTASEAELDSLWGIGAARATAIIENRPYASMEELIIKAKITQEVLDKNQGKIGL